MPLAGGMAHDNEGDDEDDDEVADGSKDVDGDRAETGFNFRQVPEEE